MVHNKQILVWTDRPPFFIKTPFIHLAKVGYSITFLYKRGDEQADRVSIHSLDNYEDCKILKCDEVLKTKRSLINYLSNYKDAIHIVNGFYISTLLKHNEIKKIFPDSKIYLLTEKPQTFKKPAILFKPLSSFSSYIRMMNNQKHVDGIFALGEDACSYFIKHGWKEDKIHNFMYSFDFEKITIQNCTKSRSSKVFRFLYVGRFDFEIKGVNYLLSVIEEFEKAGKECVFDFVGGYGKNAKEVLEFINVHSSCNFVGQVSFYDVFNKISSSDCVIIPSVKDGWNINVLQALCCGKPVVATDGAGSEKLVSAFSFGTICKKKSVSSLKMSLVQMLEDKNYYLKCKTNALKYSKYFSNELLGNYIIDTISNKGGNLY